MEEKIELQHLVCNCCGEDIGNDDYYEFNGSILCNLCFHSETVECSHCGDRIWADDNAGSDSMPLCNSCYDDYYTTCECCGRIIHRDYANYDDDDDYAYCDRCYEERQQSCNAGTCGQDMRTSDRSNGQRTEIRKLVRFRRFT